MRKDTIVVVLLLLLALLTFLFSDEIYNLYESIFGPKDKRPTIAILKESDGPAKYKLPKTLRYREAKKGLELKDLDTLVTDESTTAVVQFKSGFELEILPNSIFIIEEPETGDDGTIRITFLRGQFNILKQASGAIVKDSKPKVPKPIRITMTPPTTTTLPKKDILDTVQVEEIKAPKRRKRKKKKRIRESLPDAYVTGIVKKQRTFFQHCYERFRKVNPEERGSIQFAFTIEPSGSVSTVSIVGATISDPVLQKCSMDVLKRMKFKSFDGDPFVFVYPINYE